MTKNITKRQRGIWRGQLIIPAAVLLLALNAYCLPLCSKEGAKRGYACMQLDPSPTPVPTPSADSNASWITNQGGGEKACDNTDIPANVETQVSSDNAGAVDDTRPWNYMVSGYLRLRNLSNDTPAVVSVRPYIGPGEWSPAAGPVNVEPGDSDVYVIPPTQTEGAAYPVITADFRARVWLIDPDTYVGFWVTVLSNQPITCIYTNYDTTEHD